MKAGDAMTANSACPDRDEFNLGAKSGILAPNDGRGKHLPDQWQLLTKEERTMPVIDYDYDPLDELDTGVAKEWTDAEVRAMLDEDEERIQALKRHKQIFILMHKVLDEIEREHAEDSGATTSILREKILRGVGLSDSELESIVFSETCRLIFEKLTTKEFLRRMVLVSQLVDLDAE
jgi:hypothetical protein